MLSSWRRISKFFHAVYLFTSLSLLFPLQSNFRINELSSLYERYVQRLQNAYFVVFLLLQMSISLAIICILLLYNQVSVDK